MARGDEDSGRIFTKKVGDETKTRRVFTPQDEVAALFEGFTETKPAKAAAKAAPAGGGGAGAGSTNSGK